VYPKPNPNPNLNCHASLQMGSTAPGLFVRVFDGDYQPIPAGMKARGFASLNSPAELTLLQLVLGAQMQRMVLKGLRRIRRLRTWQKCVLCSHWKHHGQHRPLDSQ